MLVLTFYGWSWLESLLTLLVKKSAVSVRKHYLPLPSDHTPRLLTEVGDCFCPGASCLDVTQ